METTDYTEFSDNEEKLARVLCESEGVDPNKDVGGLGVRIPKDFSCKAWQVRLPQIRAILEAM